MKSAVFKVLKPGIQTTVQDLGRNGFQAFGISPAGAMDSYSMEMANILVGNPTGEAVLEAALIGPHLKALNNMTIAICGGDFSPAIDGTRIALWKSFHIRKGQVLTMGHSKFGARAYIAIAGGLEVSDVLGSKSTFLNGKFGGFEGRSLQYGDILYGVPTVRKPLKAVHPKLIPLYQKQIEVQVILGPHHERFTDQSLQQFLTEEYRLTAKSNRMGLQLLGPKLEHNQGPDIISDAVPLGGIQVPASGQPIILMADRQTTGGYTRIATVISTDIPKLAQAVPDTIVKFSQTTLQEAHRLYLERRRLLKRLALHTK